MEGLYVVLGPKDTENTHSVEKDKESKKRRLKTAKLFGLDEVKDEDEKQEPDSDSFIEKLKIRAIQNLQIFCEKIHVRYEDLSQPFAFGVTVDSFFAQTADDKWNPFFIKEIIQSQIIRKIVDLNGFSVYMNTGKDALIPGLKLASDGSLSGAIQMARILEKGIYKQSNKENPNHAYIVHPLSARLQFQYDEKQEEKLELPITTLTFVLARLQLSLNRDQFKATMDVVKSFTISKSKKYYVKKPKILEKIRPSENPSLWWSFVLNSVMDVCHKRREAWRWDRILDYLHKRRLYCDLYSKKKRDKITKLETKSLKECEDILSYEDIISCRRLVSSNLLKAKKEQAASDRGFFSFFSKSSKVNEKETMKEIYDIIDFKAKESGLKKKLPRDYIKTKVSFLIGDATATLHKKCDKSGLISRLIVDKMDISVAFREENSTELRGHIGDFTVWDERNRNARKVVSIMKSQDHLKAALVRFDTHTWDTPTPIDFRIWAQFQPLSVTVSVGFIEELTRFFEVKEVDAKKNLWDVTELAVDMIKSRAESGLKNIMQSRPTILLNLVLPSPKVVIRLENDSNLVLFLGNTKISCDTIGRNDVPLHWKEMISSNIETLNPVVLYDTFKITTEGVCLYIASKNKTKDYILEDFNMSLELKLRNLRIRTLAKIKIGVNLGHMNIHISNDKIEQVSKSVKSFYMMGQRHATPQAVTYEAPPQTVFIDETLDLLMDDTDGSDSEGSIAKYPRRKRASLIDFAFHGEGIHVFASQSQERNYLLITINIENVGMCTYVTNHDVKVKIDLGDINIEDNYCYNTPFGQKQGLQHILRPRNPEKAVVSMELTHTYSKSPDYMGVDNEINLGLSDMDIFVNRATVASIMLFLNNLITTMKLQWAVIESTTSVSNSGMALSPKLTQNIILASMTLSVNELRLHLKKEAIVFFTFELGQIAMDLAIKHNDDVAISGSLGNLSLHSVDQVRWNTLLTNMGDHVGSFKLILYGSPSTPQRPHDIEVQAKVEELKLVVVARLIEELAAYFSEFLRILTIFGLPESKDSVAKLLISVNHPIIVIPEKSTSDSFFTLDLGVTTIQNKFVMAGKSFFEVIQVNVAHMHMTSHFNLNEPPVEIFEDIAINLNVLKPLGNVKTDNPTLKISGDVSNIKLSISDQDICHIFKLFEGNLSEPITRSEEAEIGLIVSNLQKVDIKLLKNLFQSQKEEHVSNEIDFAVNVNNIQIQVQINKDDDPDTLLLSLFNIKFHLNGDIENTLHLKASVHHIQVTDVKVLETSIFGHFLDFLDDESQDHFVFKLDHNPKEQSDFISLSLSSPRIYIVPTTVERIVKSTSTIFPNIQQSLKIWEQRPMYVIQTYKRFILEHSVEKRQEEHKLERARLMEYYNRIKASFNSLEENQILELNGQITREIRAFRSSQQKKEQQVIENEKIPKESELSLKVSLYAPEICIIMNESKYTYGFKIQLGDSMMKLSLLGNRIQALGFNLYEFKVDKFSIDPKSGKIEEPTDIIRSFDVQLTSHAGANLSIPLTIRAEVSDLSIIISYTDIKITLAVWKRLQLTIERIEQMVALEAKNAPSPNEQSGTTPLQANIQTAKIALRLIEDDRKTYPIPIFKLQVHSIEGSLNTLSNTKNVTITDLELDSYNKDLSSYEPALEACTFNVDVSIQEHDMTDVSIHSCRNLDFNISRSLIDASISLSNLVEYAMRNLESDTLTWIDPSKQTVKRHFDPYIIKNALKYPISVVLNESKVTELTLDEDEESPLRHKMQDSSFKLVDISILMPNATVLLHKIPLDKVHTKMYEITDLNHVFVSEVTRVGGTKIVTIRLPGVISNTTPYAMEVRFLTSKNQEESLYIPPHAKRSFKSMHLFEKISIRPSDRKFTWSEWASASGIIQCYHHGSDTAWYCYLKKEEVDHFGPKEVLLTFSALVSIENLLPVLIVTKLGYQDGNRFNKIQNLDIDSGNQVFLYESTKQINPSDLSCKIQVAGYKWSAVHTFQHPETEITIPLDIEDIDAHVVTFNLLYLQENALLRVILYSKYWIVNQTGLTLSYRSSVHKQIFVSESRQIDVRSDPRLWYKDDFASKSAAQKSFYSDKDIAIQIQSTPWSSYFDVNPRNSKSLERRVELDDVATGRRYHFTLLSSNVIGKLWRTKEIRIVPSMMIANKSEYNLKYGQKNGPKYDLLKGDVIPFHWSMAKKEKDLQMWIADMKLEHQISNPLKIVSPSHFFIKIRNIKTNSASLLNANIYDEGGTTFIVFNPSSSGIINYKIVNNSRTSIFVSQNDGKGYKDLVPAFKSMPYFLDNPLARTKEILLTSSDGLSNAFTVNLESSILLQKPWNRGKEVYYVSVLIDGLKRVITISDKETPPTLELKTVQNQLNIRLDLNVIGISLIGTSTSKKVQELLYLSFQQLIFNYLKVDNDATLSVSLKRIQVDRCHPSRVMIYSVLSKEKANFLTLQMGIHDVEGTDVKVLHNIKSFLSPIEVNLTQDIILAVARNIEETVNYIVLQKGWSSDILTQETILPQLNSDFLDRIFFKEVYLNRIRIVLSLERSLKKEELSASLLGISMKILGILLKISTIHRANLDIENFSSNQDISSSHSFLQRLSEHFKDQMLSKIKNLLLNYVKSIFITNSVMISTVRSPRFIPMDQLLTPYDLEMSYGQHLMDNATGNIQKGEIYQFHCWLPQRRCLIVGHMHMYMLHKNQVEWKEPLEELLTFTDTCPIQLFFDSEYGRARDVPCEHTHQQEYILSKLEWIVKRNASFSIL